MGKKIAAYMRISVDTEKDRDNTSIENQRRIIKAYLKQRFPDAEVDYYVDRDRSGYTFEQRESYMKMRPLLMSDTLSGSARTTNGKRRKTGSALLRTISAKSASA